MTTKHDDDKKNKKNQKITINGNVYEEEKYHN